MNESKTTFIFVSVAAVLALAAFGSHFLNQPANSADFELVGKPFFEGFTSASQAQSLEVAAVDAESGVLKRFVVENQGGLWRIPSHYDYPAEAAARLATTASSVMGIGRDSLAGRLAKEHARLGVLDPLADDIEDPEGVGKRITLKDGGGEVVVDYIVGKEAGEVDVSETDQPFRNPGREKYYYVRRPDEQQTYKVKLDIDLSTKFSDWIDPDLLRVDRNDVTKISIDNYSLEEDRSNPLAPSKAIFKSQGDKLDLSRKSSTDAWELADLKPEDEDVNTSRINAMLDVFDQMKIAGVRPKYKYKNHLLLTADLKLNQQPEFEQNPQEFARAINRLQNELDQKGFNLAGNAQKMELVSQNGDLEIGTDKGVVYTLHVGKSFDGDEEAIEIGTGSDANSDSETDSQPDNADPTKTEAGNSSEPEANESDASGDPKETSAEAKNRYLMVRVSFDESLIKPKPVTPVPPIEPVKPEGYAPPPEDEAAKADKPDVDAPGEDAVEKPPADDKPERDPEFVKYDEAIKAFEDQKIDYELAKTRFESETDAFEKKVVEGRKLVDELNERFGDWYYVISGDNLNTLQTQRADLVTKKEKPAGEADAPTRPDISFPDLPGAIPDSNQELNVEPQGDVKEEPQGEVKEDPKGEVKVDPKGEVKEDPKGEVKEDPKGEVKVDPKPDSDKDSGGVESDAKKDEITESVEKAANSSAGSGNEDGTKDN